MGRTEEEIKLLHLLKTGELDGNVGEMRTFRVYSAVCCGRYIKKGIPTVFHEGRLRTSLLGKEKVSAPIKREEEKCITEESKLLFLRKYGWLIDNEYVRNYSRKFKNTEKKRSGGNK